MRECENTGILGGIVSGYVVKRNPQRRPGTHPRRYRTPLRSTILKTHPSTQYGNAARTPTWGEYASKPDAAQTPGWGSVREQAERRHVRSTLEYYCPYAPETYVRRGIFQYNNVLASRTRRISTGNEQSSLYIYYRQKILRSPYDVHSTRESTRILVVYGTYVKWNLQNAASNARARSIRPNSKCYRML